MLSILKNTIISVKGKIQQAMKKYLYEYDLQSYLVKITSLFLQDLKVREYFLVYTLSLESRNECVLTS